MARPTALARPKRQGLISWTPSHRIAGLVDQGGGARRFAFQRRAHAVRQDPDRVVRPAARRRDQRTKRGGIGGRERGLRGGLDHAGRIMFDVDRLDEHPSRIGLAHAHQQSGAVGHPIDRVETGRHGEAREQGAAQQDRGPARRQGRIEPPHQSGVERAVGGAERTLAETEIAGPERADEIGRTRAALGNREIVGRARQRALIERDLLDVAHHVARDFRLRRVAGRGGRALLGCLRPSLGRGFLLGRRKRLGVAEARREKRFGLVAILREHRQRGGQGAGAGKPEGPSAPGLHW